MRIGKIGRAMVTSAVVVSALVAGVLQTPVGGHQVAIIGGTRDGATAQIGRQVAIIGGTRDGATAQIGRQQAIV